MSAEPILSIKDLSIALPASGERALAVENLNLEVFPGEILCVVGESGSGKSVTAFASIGLLAKVLEPTNGYIRLGGDDILSMSERELQNVRGKQVGMVFQEPMTALNPSFTVGNQIEEMFWRHQPEMSSSARRDKVLSILEEVQLPDPPALINAYPRQLSGGQCQRIVIAMAMALSPTLLIADEPTTALDVTTQARILDLIKDLRKNHGAGIMFITHDFGVVAEVADRVIVMEKGRLVEQGTVAKVIGNPQHPYTQKLVAAIPRMRSTIMDHGALGGETPLLSARNIRKTFSTKQGMFRRIRRVDAVKGFNLDLRLGESLAIVGESGSGKSTVANCMLRLQEADAGTMHINGQDFFALSGEELRSARRDIQVVFQDPYGSLNPRKSIRNTLLQGPRNFGISDEISLKLAKELLDIVQLDGNALSRFPNQFSGGQRQRICIARALMLEPKILIADEAVSALDVSIQAEVLRLLADIRRRLNLTILFITHDLRVASQVCDRVIVIRYGEVIEDGSIVDVFKTPQHAYTCMLLDATLGKNLPIEPVAEWFNHERDLVLEF